MYTFDVPSLAHIIAISVRAVLAEHGLEMTEDDQNAAGEAASTFLNAMHRHKLEQLEMVDSVSRDLDELPVLGGEAPIPREAELRRLGIEPSVWEAELRRLGIEPPV